jgi:stage V sporulation protein AD
MYKKIGQQSMVFALPPKVMETAAIGGPMEGQGPLAAYFDRVMDDTLNGCDSWEKCESSMLEWVIKTAIQKGHTPIDQIDYILAGDLLNQLMSAHFAVRSLNRPFIGIYGACSSMALTMITGAMVIDGGFAHKVVGAVSSHHDAAERQYRFPTELGTQRPPLAQWTVTGAGAALLSDERAVDLPKISAATVGKIVDMGISDPNAMGPAMAPAAVDTIVQHFQDTGRNAAYYDGIYTGDLGAIGKQLVADMLYEAGYNIRDRYEDCGCLVYGADQDAHAGASGCASSATVFCGLLYKKLLQKDLKKLLLVGTGSLHSTTSYQQKETIPCIAHAVAIEG